MTAKEAISAIGRKEGGEALPRVGGDMPLLEVLPRLLDSPTRRLLVEEEGETCGIIDGDSLLEAMGHMIAARDDSSVVTMECMPGEYSASHIARAVEDADVHLVDMLTVPGRDGRLSVTLRVRCQDPTSVVHSLERYGYEVTESHGDNSAGAGAALERMLGLKAILDV